ncbi:DUF3023 domain-containing protein [Ehrlichia ruminantium]|uniref:DUF3023 domain-containing protein n=1 Tax=Ehrlichia ruminantium TaxID=779 RepID=A0AAE6QDF6_EHRRU|nr:DUF3023 domain-containing protein [Ehrlichia ruminantium]QGR03530.1 DUF3023 domain-containing protein [Ehrlichia ruminantium]QGR04457.1 DUF3023 domain-containing protein [Ehrlichia ruminantium]
MLLNNDPEYTKDLHQRVIEDLNDMRSKITVYRFRCIGNTDSNGNLIVHKSKSKGHRCNPEGKTLFYLKCTFSSKTVKKHEAIKELLSTFVYDWFPTPIFEIGAYFLAEEPHAQKLYDILTNSGVKQQGSCHVNFDLSSFGQFILCKPLLAGRMVKCSKNFNEEEALKTLGGLENAIFIDIDTHKTEEKATCDVELSGAQEGAVGGVSPSAPPYPGINVYSHVPTGPSLTQVGSEEEHGAVGGITSSSAPLHKPKRPTSHIYANEPGGLPQIGTGEGHGTTGSGSEQHIYDTIGTMRRGTGEPQSRKWLTKSYLKKKFTGIIGSTATQSQTPQQDPLYAASIPVFSIGGGGGEEY